MADGDVGVDNIEHAISEANKAASAANGAADRLAAAPPPISVETVHQITGVGGT